MSNNQNLKNNISYISVARTVFGSLSGMMGLYSYYLQKLNSPMLAVTNFSLFFKKIVPDILKLDPFDDNQHKYVNSVSKMFFGLGIISLVNYAKFYDTINSVISVVNSNSPSETTNTTIFPITTNHPITFNNLIDWGTYISLNSYGVGSIISGITELFPEKFDSTKKVVNSLTAGALISTGVFMAQECGYYNCYSILTMASGVNELANQGLTDKFNKKRYNSISE